MLAGRRQGLRIDEDAFDAPGSSAHVQLGRVVAGIQLEIEIERPVDRDVGDRAPRVIELLYAVE